jgi:hypothetical protein
MAQALLTADWPHTANSPYPAVTLAWVEAIERGVGFFRPAAPATPGSDDYAFAALPRWRLSLSLLNSLLLLAMAWLVARLYDKAVAVTSLLLLALDPFFLTEARTFRTEGLTTGLMILSALTIMLYVRRRRRGWLVASGVLAALASLTRISALFMLPFAGLVLLSWPLLTASPRLWPWLKQSTLEVVLWSGVMGGTFLLLWPALWSDPFNAANTLGQYLGPAVAEASRVWKKGVFFRGQPMQGVDPGLRFYGWVLAFRTTPLMDFGLVVAGLAGLRFVVEKFGRRRSAFSKDNPLPNPPPARGREPHQPGLSETQATTLLILAFALFYLVAINLTAIKIDRYLVAIFPALAILAALGLQALVRALAASTGRRMLGQSLLWLGLVLAGAALSLPHHPYYYTYWNPLWGGGPVAVGQLPAMGRQGVAELVNYLNALPDAATLRLAGTGLDLDFVQECPQVFVGDCLWYPDFLASDYFLMSTYSVQNDVYLAHIGRLLPDAEIVRAYCHGGVTYAWLYQMPPGLYHVGHWLDRSAGSFRGYRLPTGQLAAGEPVEVTLFWQNGEENGWQFADSDLFVKVLDPAGRQQQLVAARLTPASEPYLNQPNEILAFVAHLDFPPDTALGRYTMEMGLRLKATGEETVNFALPVGARTLTVGAGTSQPLAPAHRLDQPLGPSGLTLVGYEPQPDAARLDLYFRAESRLSQEYALHLTWQDRQQRPLASWQRPLAPDFHPLSAWAPGETVKLPFPLELGYPLGTAEGQLELTVLAGPDSLASLSLPASVAPARPEPAMHHRLAGLTFGQNLDLLGYDLNGDLASGRFVVTLYWLKRDSLSPLEAQLQVLAGDGAVIGEALQPVPAPADLWRWSSSSRFEFHLASRPATLLIRARPGPAEPWYAELGQIDQVLAKTAALAD